MKNKLNFNYENLVKVIFENTSDLILLLEKSNDCCDYIIVNKSFENITKIKREDIIGKKFGSYLSDGVHQMFCIKSEEAIANKSTVTFETEFELLGDKIYLKVNVTPIFTEASTKLLVIGQNISDSKKSELEFLLKKGGKES